LIFVSWLVRKKKDKETITTTKKIKKVLKKNGKAVASWEFKFDGQINLSS